MFTTLHVAPENHPATVETEPRIERTRHLRQMLGAAAVGVVSTIVLIGGMEIATPDTPDLPVVQLVDAPESPAALQVDGRLEYTQKQ